MKFVRTLSVITLLVVILSVSLVSALEQNEASVTTFMPGDTVVRGETGQLKILFTSNTDKDLSVYYVGIHLDWMDEDQLFGIDYSSSPKTALAMKDLIISDIINYTIPTSVSVGAHTYYIGIDGYDEDGNPFSWKSDDATIYVTNPTSTTANPSATPTANNGNSQTFDMTILLYVALGVAAVVIVVLVLALIKKRGPATAANTDANQPGSPKPEEKPSEKQDFNI